MIKWQDSGPVPGEEYSDISYETAGGVAKITINRPCVRNAFRPATPLYPMSDEAQKGGEAFEDKRCPGFARFPRRP